MGRLIQLASAGVMFSARWGKGKRPPKPQKTLDKMAFFRYNLFRLAAGGKQGEKVKPEGCFIMEPTRNPRGGPKDEQTEKRLFAR